MRMLLSLLLAGVVAQALPVPEKPSHSNVDVKTIIEKSVAGNDRDFKLGPDFNYKQRETTGGVTKTSQVTMIDGSPYTKLLAINGHTLSADKAAEEERKMTDAIKQRSSESASQRQDRIAKFEKGRKSDHEMMSQLTVAFNFILLGTHQLRGYTVWALKAIPKPGYQPPNMDCQVLPGMQGEMWIDQKTYEWVKVTARVIHPVAIDGVLAQVQPGTRFEIEKNPVGQGIWQITHYSSHADAHVLFLFNHEQDDRVTYFDFQRIQP
jgi:hypothetical protein